MSPFKDSLRKLVNDLRKSVLTLQSPRLACYTSYSHLLTSNLNDLSPGSYLRFVPPPLLSRTLPSPLVVSLVISRPVSSVTFARLGWATLARRPSPSVSAVTVPILPPLSDLSNLAALGDEFRREGGGVSGAGITQHMPRLPSPVREEEYP